MKIALTYTKFWENIFNTNNVFLAINLPNHAHIIAKKKVLYLKEFKVLDLVIHNFGVKIYICNQRTWGNL